VEILFYSFFEKIFLDNKVVNFIDFDDTSL
jgi:hypothetical protein